MDFALCHPPEKPLVFIEVKQVGNLDGAEEQLFGYAFREGVPIAILTDGQKWRFFHPTGEGKFRERKVHELDLIESDSEESVERLNRYLNYEAVQEGEAVTAIKNDYQKVSKQREIEARLPEFWNELLQDKNEYLLLAVMEKAKSKVGYEPIEDQVLTFLKSLSVQNESEPEYSPNPQPNPDGGSQRISLIKNPIVKKRAQTSLIVTLPNREVINHKDAKTTFAEVIGKLGIEKVMHIKPNVVSTSPFPRGNVQQGQFYINTHCSNEEKKTTLERIAHDLNISLKVETVDKK